MKFEHDWKQLPSLYPYAMLVTGEAVVMAGSEHASRSALLASAMEDLSERERDIFAKRRLSEDPPTLEELGQHYGISRERVRQLEARAYKRVEEAVLAASAE